MTKTAAQLKVEIDALQEQQNELARQQAEIEEANREALHQAELQKRRDERIEAQKQSLEKCRPVAQLIADHLIERGHDAELGDYNDEIQVIVAGRTGVNIAVQEHSTTDNGYPYRTRYSGKISAEVSLKYSDKRKYAPKNWTANSSQLKKIADVVARGAAAAKREADAETAKHLGKTEFYRIANANKMGYGNEPVSAYSSSATVYKVGLLNKNVTVSYNGDVVKLEISVAAKVGTAKLAMIEALLLAELSDE